MRRFLVVLSALGLVLAPACGDEGGPAEALGIVQAAGAATRSEGTAKVELTAEVPASAGESAEGMTLGGEGVFDLEAGRGSLTMALPDELVVAGGPKELTMAFEGTTMYMKVPGAQEALGVETDWVSIDIVEVGEGATGTDLTQQMGGGNDPTQTLAMLQGASDDVEEVGKEDVRGEPTTHYHATVDLRRAVEKSGEITDPAQFERFMETLGSETIETDVWIDGEGRVRRQQYEQPVPQAGNAVTVTVEFFDFGTSDEPEIPDAADVTDITEQIKQQAEGAPA